MLGSIDEWLCEVEEVVREQVRVRQVERELPHVSDLAERVVEAAQSENNSEEMVYEMLSEITPPVKRDANMVKYASILVNYPTAVWLYTTGIMEHLYQGVEKDEQKVYRARDVVTTVLKVGEANAQANYLMGCIMTYFGYGANEESLKFLERAVGLAPEIKEYQEDRDYVAARVEEDRVLAEKFSGSYGGILVF